MVYLDPGIFELQRVALMLLVYAYVRDPSSASCAADEHSQIHPNRQKPLDDLIQGPAVFDIAASSRKNGYIHGGCKYREFDVRGGKGTDGCIDGMSIATIDRV